MYDLVVLGAGAGGLEVALGAARLGARVALIDKRTPVGGYTRTAALSSKALIAAARLAQQIRGADRFGLGVAPPAVDFAAVMARVRAVAADPDPGRGYSDDSLRSQGIDVLHGAARFEAYDTVVVDGTTRLNAQRFVIATGSRPAVPPIPGLAEAGAFDSDSIWSLDALPAELIVLSSEPVGIELAQAYARLGSKVTVLVGTPSILPREDAEVSSRAQAILAAEGIAFRTNVEVAQVVIQGDRRVCTVRDKATSAMSEVSGTHLLVATGRLANVEGLNLEAVGVHASPEHGIEVDEYLQTRSTRVFAIGDVVLRHPFAHAAEREAAVAVHNAVLRIPKKIEYAAMPWATFLDPEVASVGLTEADASAQHPGFRVLRAELSEAERARIDGRTDGFAKLVASASGKILGATIMGPDATLVIQELVLAMEHGLTLQQIAETFHIYPTYVSLVRRLATEFVAARSETNLVHRALRWFHGYQPRAGASDGGTASEAKPADHAQPAGHTNGHGH
jgi:pyruvate/2-oxoglutarate dehydrogenase complex dihydrolipoamide dehydrogenase (E3) component